MKRDDDRPFVELYADGACSGNPGVGGFGAILKSGGKVMELSDSEEMTTNNRMEMLGVITALEALKVPCRVRVTTDSVYVVKGMTEWVEKWERQGWKTFQRKEVANRDLWERMLKASRGHDIEWIWVKGHNGHVENERCDELARLAIMDCRKRRG
ncbi:MAG: ribonuclease HI [Nitrospirae bacterium]|nr:ribonuclease HI [Nitrospirota bacterium]